MLWWTKYVIGLLAELIRQCDTGDTKFLPTQSQTQFITAYQSHTAGLQRFTHMSETNYSELNQPAQIFRLGFVNMKPDPATVW